MIYTCGEGHETAIYPVNGVETVVTNDYLTGKMLQKIVPATENGLRKMKARLEEGDCPLCDNWEYEA